MRNPYLRWRPWALGLTGAVLLALAWPPVGDAVDRLLAGRLAATAAVEAAKEVAHDTAERVAARAAQAAPPEPWQATVIEAGLVGGVWRVVADVEVGERCGHVTLDRAFADTVASEMFRLTALRAPFDPRPIVAVDLRPGRYERLVWEYEPQPGRSGHFRLWASISECPSGFNKTISLMTVPYDWADLPQDPAATPPPAAG